MISLPKRIHPNPLIDSTVEIRFASDLVNPDNALNYYMEAMPQGLSFAKDRRIPLLEPSLITDATYIFANNQYKIFADVGYIAFGCQKEYMLWNDAYFPFIRNTLNHLNQKSLFGSISRIGIRYRSFLELKPETPVLKFDIEFQIANFTRHSDELIIRFFNEKGIKIILKIIKFVKFKEGDNPERDGVLIDIDVFDDTSTSEINEDFFNLINEIHSEEKKLFFALLNPEYLKLLNPEY